MAVEPIKQPISERLAAWAAAFEPAMLRMMTPGPDAPAVLVEAMRYAVQGGGKRLRPYLVTRMCELCDGNPERALPAAVAIECVHAFSLVHDDLPAMDNDDLRRGRPTCHKAFGEAVAILAGDALVTLAFEIPACHISQSAVAVAVIAELAQATGWMGMIGGQTHDILGEKLPIDLALVEQIHRYKTARLLQCAARLGAVCAEAEGQETQAAATYGLHLGIAFQIADDLLDATGDAALMGKAVAKDAAAGKQTYPAAVGIEASRAAARQQVDLAIEALSIFGPEADDLRDVAHFVIDRNR